MAGVAGGRRASVGDVSSSVQHTQDIAQMKPSRRRVSWCPSSQVFKSVFVGGLLLFAPQAVGAAARSAGAQPICDKSLMALGKWHRSWTLPKTPSDSRSPPVVPLFFEIEKEDGGICSDHITQFENGQMQIVRHVESGAVYTYDYDPKKPRTWQSVAQHKDGTHVERWYEDLKIIKLSQTYPKGRSDKRVAARYEFNNGDEDSYTVYNTYENGRVLKAVLEHGVNVQGPDIFLQLREEHPEQVRKLKQKVKYIETQEHAVLMSFAAQFVTHHIQYKHDGPDVTDDHWDVLPKLEKKVRQDLEAWVKTGLWGKSTNKEIEAVFKPYLSKITPLSIPGDCEDRALAIRNVLISMGVPREALRLMMVENKSGAHHMALCVRTKFMGKAALSVLDDDCYPDILDYLKSKKLILVQSPTFETKWIPGNEFLKQENAYAKQHNEL